MDPVPFRSGAAFRRWLARHHASATELVLLFYKKESGRGGITYAEALDEALCYGWIDGIRRSLDAEGYTIRFTPRKPKSFWSRVNVRHIERLIGEGRMQPPGLAAFKLRVPERTGVYSFEQPTAELPPAMEAQFRREQAAYEFFLAQPPGYRRTILRWVTSAKQDVTRERRICHLIRASADRRRLDLMAPNA
ncbi:YdeI/OmpD-associated family protein [Opitutus sp. ER46]|uniref:YdeI/OmpD-associated family protein n=1 Tax=Opitutus sp. ER46 TaxID=2161864 RepID=UPI000D2FD60D|nr:YdeI/OmpD-associated family protein [Opitutus sp. ER46]PTX97925.1 bacteriocin-protection protein [Opitutus sp. ER46]